MFTLIRREIEDHIVYFIAALAFSLVFSLITIISSYQENFAEEYGVMLPALYIVLTVIIIIWACAMGTSQMYVDRNRKISAFLSTLPVSRNQIFAARVLAGVTALVVLLAAPAITVEVLLSGFRVEQAIHKYYTVEIFSTLFLLGLGIYCTGLMGGFSSSKIVPTLGSLVLSVVLLTIIIIKGLGAEAMIILFVYIAACLGYTWRKFNTTALI